ncbi:hypothetical protein B0H14DRAFT_3449751 [Mycena olivaceomarginata]|nr:hypothetical protein B0H14DRAFT_3449751 [Mycena olivaceomarginata]
MSLTRLPYTVYNAFTSKKFRGNPAVVLLLQPDHSLLELNLSDTAFLVPLKDHSEAAPHFSLRWFTPTLEAPLCRHVTLGAACHLHDKHPELQPPYRFALHVSGELKVNYHRDSDLYELNFPADIPVPVADAAVGLKMAQTWFPELTREDFKFFSKTQPGYLVEVAETVDVPTVRHNSVTIARNVPGAQCVLTTPHKPTAEDPLK